MNMPPLVLRKLPPPRHKPRMPVHPWKQTAVRTERLQEQQMARLAARISDQAQLNEILGVYPENVRGRVLARIRQYLKFETTTLTAAGPDADTAIVVGAPLVDGPVLLVDSERRIA